MSTNTYILFKFCRNLQNIAHHQRPMRVFTHEWTKTCSVIAFWLEWYLFLKWKIHCIINFVSLCAFEVCIWTAFLIFCVIIFLLENVTLIWKLELHFIQYLCQFKCLSLSDTPRCLVSSKSLGDFLRFSKLGDADLWIWRPLQGSQFLFKF